MLTITGYGIKLKRLTIEDIELVRYWRNTDNIRRYMEYREEITPEMQRNWFKSIDNIYNFYFLIEVDNTYIGLINGAQMDWHQGITNSGGIFIWDESYWATEVPFNASMLITDFSFAIGLKTIRAKILRDNPRSITFNKNLGFKMVPGQENEYNQLYELNRENFEKSTQPVRNILIKRYGARIKTVFIKPLIGAEEQILEIFKKADLRSSHVSLDVYGE